MLKAAILYADKVKLYSPKVPSILAMARFKDFPLNLRLEFFERVLPYLSSTDGARKLSTSLSDYRKILTKQNLNVQDLQFKSEFESTLDKNWEEIASETSKFVKDSHIDQIHAAIKAGVLELHEFKGSDGTGGDNAALNLLLENAAAISAINSRSPASKPEQDLAWIQEFVENISNSVSNASTYPLLDAEMGSMVNKGMTSKQMDIAGIGIDHGKQTGLAKYLLERLPLFEEASVDEILDIRKELDKPLTRFRSAIIGFSDDIKSTPWDKGFPIEADKIYHRDVKPAMLDIEEAIQSNNFMRTVAKKFKEKPTTLPATSLITMAISQFSSLPEELTASLGLGIGSASLLYEAYEEWKKNKKSAEQNNLYFYYGVGERLKK